MLVFLSHKRAALLIFALLLLCLGLSCFVWVRKEQRQYALALKEYVNVIPF